MSFNLKETLKIATQAHHKGELKAAQQGYIKVIEASPNHLHAMQLLATTYLQQGMADRALPLFKQVIEADPSHWSSLNNAAICCNMSKNFSEALAFTNRAIAVKPDYREALNTQNHALRGLGNNKEALKSVKKALQLDTSALDSNINLADTLVLLKQYDAALSAFKIALTIQPEHIDSRAKYANCLRNAGKQSDALHQFKKVLEKAPKRLSTLLNTANLLGELKRYTEAKQYYDFALTQAPDDLMTLYGLGHASQQLEDFDDALDFAEQGLAIDARHIKFLGLKSAALRGLEKFDPAIDCCKKILKQKPDCVETWTNLGVILNDAAKPLLAKKAYLTALGINKNAVNALQNLGICYMELGNDQAAMKCYQQSRVVAPDDHRVDLLIALIQLRHGDFTQGWHGYEARFQLGLVHKTVKRPALSNPQWHYPESAPKSLFVWAEQGIGDQIMFASCLQDLAITTPKIVLSCQARLLDLLTRSFPEIEVIKDQNVVPEHVKQGCEKQISIASLPLHTRPNRDSFRSQKPYLIPCENTVKKWRSRYSKLEHNFTVGISWRGGNGPRRSHRRSIDLDQWSELVKMPANFINLQYGDHRTEIEAFIGEGNPPLHDWEDSCPTEDLDDFAAQIAALDLVISVDNSSVHMAGALGIQTLVILPLNAEWRWLAEEDSAYWYPDTVRFIRQTSLDDWEAPLHTAKQILAEIIAEQSK